MENILVIGIAGGSGSGKTTLTTRLAEQFPEEVTVIRHDDYYKHYEELTLEERKLLNYDHPNAFDTELLIRHLMELKQGRPVECPVYDYAVYNRSGRTRTIQPRRVVIVEGILIFKNRSLCDLMDIRVFVDTDADIRIIRRIQRDVVERGRSLESVIGQYINTVKPMHEQFVEPSKDVYKRQAVFLWRRRLSRRRRSFLEIWIKKWSSFPAVSFSGSALPEP